MLQPRPGASALAAAPAAQGSCLTLSTGGPLPLELGPPFDLVFNGTPGELLVLAVSEGRDPTTTPLGTFEVALAPRTSFFFPGVVPTSGTLALPCPTTCGLDQTEAPLSFAPLQVSCLSVHVDAVPSPARDPRGSGPPLLGLRRHA